MKNQAQTTAAFENLLEEDGHLAFNLAIYNRFNQIGDQVYSEICGGFIEGVYQWATHNIEDVNRCENEKYIGWTITFESGAERKVFIERRILNIEPKNWKHAKNLFNKYLRQVPIKA